MKELQPAMDKIHQRLVNIENIASANKELTRIEMKLIDKNILEYTSLIRDRIKQFKTMMKNQGTAAHAEEE
eukprot:11361721-Heterocapsa_arctica.AAC.1